MAPNLFRYHIITAILLTAFALPSLSQDTLPRFNAELRGTNRVLVSWTNPYGRKIRQLSIQRSADSLRMFKTIMTLPDPTVLQNGYLDTRTPDTSQFYRLYILLDSGRYVFSNSKRATRPRPSPPPAATQPTSTGAPKPGKPVNTTPVTTPTEPAKPLPPPHYFTIKRGDTLKGRIEDSQLRRFRDSISLKTKDTLLITHPDTITIRPFVPRDVFRPSAYIYTDRKGQLNIMLPLAGRKRYRVRFFDTNKHPLFEIKEIRDKELIMEKSNFMRAGWYHFELYEDGQLLEKNRFYIMKDF